MPVPCIYGFFIVIFKEEEMKEAHRFFNLLLPFKTYEELKLLSVKTEKPIAQIIRTGIGLVLKTENRKVGSNGEN